MCFRCSWFMDREMKGDADVVCDMRLSGNSRCVIVMTNLAFAPEGRKREKEK